MPVTARPLPRAIGPQAVGPGYALGIGLPQGLEVGLVGEKRRVRVIGDEGVLDDDAEDAALARIADDAVVVRGGAVRVDGGVIALGVIARLCPATVETQRLQAVEDVGRERDAHGNLVALVATTVGIPNLGAVGGLCGRVHVKAHEYVRTGVNDIVDTFIEIVRPRFAIMGHDDLYTRVLLQCGFAVVCDAEREIGLAEPMANGARVGGTRSVAGVQRDSELASRGARKHGLRGWGRRLRHGAGVVQGVDSGAGCGCGGLGLSREGSHASGVR